MAWMRFHEVSPRRRTPIPLKHYHNDRLLGPLCRKFNTGPHQAILQIVVTERTFKKGKCIEAVVQVWIYNPIKHQRLILDFGKANRYKEASGQIGEYMIKSYRIHDPNPEWIVHCP